jgi:hypothetical protein
MFNSSDPSGRAPKRVLLSILAGALPPDVMYIDIDDGNPGSGQEWQITLDFPSGTSAVGAASSVDIEYIDHINGTNEMTFYCEPSVFGDRGSVYYPGTVFRLADADGGCRAHARLASKANRDSVMVGLKLPAII